MKDTIISADVKRRELKIWLACFIIANITNWAAIIKFQTPWYEVFTQIGYVLVTTVVIYALVALVRVAWRILKHLSK